jgi:ribosomal protein S18 acetylase RimI-like enzyme
MQIRAVKPQDAEAIGEVRVRAWRAAYQGLMPAGYLERLDARANLEKLKSTLQMTDPPYLVRVVESGQRVVAFSILGAPRYETARETGELWALNVDPSCWRLGLGRRLVAQAMADATARHWRRLELWCLADNAAALAMYESCGFVRNGKERTTSGLTGVPLSEVACEHPL